MYMYIYIYIYIHAYHSPQPHLPRPSEFIRSPASPASPGQILRCDRPMPPPTGYVYDGLAELCAPGRADP